MEGEPTEQCSACGYKLGDPEDEIARPDDENPPENPHFAVQERKDGELRAQCKETGQLASVLMGETKISPITGEVTGTVGEGDGSDRDGGSNSNNQQSSDKGSVKVFDLPEEKDQIDILADVITNSHYELTDDQIIEVRDWAKDYDGQMPPNVLENLLKNMQGIQKQTAELVRERYELKLNRWVREQSTDDDGPPIGAVTHQRGIKPGYRGGDRTATPTPATPQNTQNQSQNNQGGGGTTETTENETDEPESDLMKYRRRRRVRRRHDSADIAAEEVAKQVAPEVARELTQNLGTYFGLPAKIIEAKIEKDPDWALEVMERLDIDVFDILEPSDARKEELAQENQQTQPQVDNELDQALEQIGDRGEQSPQQESGTTKLQPDVPESTAPMEQEKEVKDEENDESFEDIFGDGDSDELPQEVR